MSEITENSVVAENEYFESNLTGEQIEEALTAIIDGTIDNAVEASASKAAEAKSWAVGGTNTRPNEEITNARYFAEMASGGSAIDGELTVGTLAVGQKDNIDRGAISPLLEGLPWITAGNKCIALGSGATAFGEESFAMVGDLNKVSSQKNLGPYNSSQLEITLDSNFLGWYSFSSFDKNRTLILFSTDFTKPSVVATLDNIYSSNRILVRTWPVVANQIDYNFDYVFMPRTVGHSELSQQSSYARGYQASALGRASVAEGIECMAKYEADHAEGHKTLAGGKASHAEGYGTKATAYCAHAEGFMTRASSSYQHVSGSNNIPDGQRKYLIIIGNGTASKQSNAYTLDWSGNGWFAGKVTVGNETKAANIPDPTAANELVTKAYADKAIAAAIQTATETFQGIIIALEARIAALEGNQ